MCSGNQCFPTDTEEELKLVETKCKELGVNVALSEVWAKGGEGGKALAEEVVRLCEEPSEFAFTYDSELSIKEKLDAGIYAFDRTARAFYEVSTGKVVRKL